MTAPELISILVSKHDTKGDSRCVCGMPLRFGDHAWQGLEVRGVLSCWDDPACKRHAEYVALLLAEEMIPTQGELT